MKIAANYKGNMRFESGEGDSRVAMDAVPEAGGRGEALTPKQMVLQGLAGCTGMDVAAMLTKKGVMFEDFSIDIDAEQTEIHPKVFKRIKIIYRIKAAPEDRANVERAIEQSKNRFCGVSAMLGKTAEISWELDFRPI